MERNARKILATRTAAELKDDYREARRLEQSGDHDANEARRLITIALIRKIGREDVALFERMERAA